MLYHQREANPSLMHTGLFFKIAFQVPMRASPRTLEDHRAKAIDIEE